MGLTPGARLGPYEIIAAIGAGGMGEVYRARDTRLGRTVAIKVLPAEFAADPDRRARFEREARAISALAHPHVCALYDVGREGNVDFLVMEHLEGETLAQRLARGPVPLDQALEYATQIAAGLYEAHRLGFVHRDLKPANVMLTRTGARLLDFGIARMRPASAQHGRDASTHMVTAEHTFVGTVPYVSPEQIAGGQVDTRSDLFSFGVLLFELVTGRLPFEGKTTAGTIAAIVENEPTALAAHLPTVPPALERLVEHCLIKTPETRWQSARDVELELRAIRGSGREATAVGAKPFVKRRRLLWEGVAAVALLASGLAAGMGWSRVREPVVAVPGPLVHFSVPLASGESIHEYNSSSLALSPDGSRIVYAVNKPGARGLYLRALDAPAATLVAGSEQASNPFFSPDGQWIAFESGGSLKKVRADGGTPVRITDTPYFSGGSWSDDGIVFAPSFTSGLFRVPAGGGRPSRLTTVDTANGEGAHLWPQVMPGGGVLFTIWMGTSFDEAKLAVFSPATGRYAVVMERGFHGRYASGRLLFARGSRVFSVPFDPAVPAATGEAEQIVDGVAGDANAGSVMFSVGGRGTLAYVPGTPRAVHRSLIAVDAQGTPRTISPDSRAFVSTRVSPDGRRIAIWLEEGASAAVFLKDLSRDPLTRLTYSGDDHGPVWSPDGRRIAFESGRASTHHLFVRAADGSGEDRQVTTGDRHHYLNDWSPDAQSLIYTEFHPETSADLWLVNVEGPPRPRPFRATRFAEKQAAFSPDGKWVAYVANDSDRNEVYVQAVGGSGNRTQLSSDGGDEPAWSRSGDRVFYRSGNRMMAVGITKTGEAAEGRPAVVFEGMYHSNISPNRSYDLAPDGRFIMVSMPDAASAPRQVNVVLNRLR